MTIQRTRWSPDTCGCVLEYEWDDAQPEDVRVHNIADVPKKCARHAPLNENKNAHWNRIMDENPRKNKALEHVRKNAPPGQLKKDDRGNDVLLDGAVEWSYDDQHVLHIKTKGFAQNDKNKVKAAVDAAFGNGKVIVE